MSRHRSGSVFEPICLLGSAARTRLRLLARLWNFLGTEKSTSTERSVSGSANQTYRNGNMNPLSPDSKSRHPLPVSEAFRFWRVSVRTFFEVLWVSRNVFGMIRRSGNCLFCCRFSRPGRTEPVGFYEGFSAACLPVFEVWLCEGLLSLGLTLWRLFAVSFAAYCLPPTVCRLLSAACCLPPTLSACPSLSAPAACLCYQARFASRLLPPSSPPPGAESGLFAGIRSRCASSPAFLASLCCCVRMNSSLRVGDSVPRGDLLAFPDLLDEEVDRLDHRGSLGRGGIGQYVDSGFESGF